MKVKIVSKLIPWRGNSWYFESPTERVYAKLTNPTKEEVAEAMAFAKDQYEKMGWQQCFVEPPVALVFPKVESVIFMTQDEIQEILDLAQIPYNDDLANLFWEYDYTNYSCKRLRIKPSAYDLEDAKTDSEAALRVGVMQYLQKILPEGTTHIIVDVSW